MKGCRSFSKQIGGICITVGVLNVRNKGCYTDPRQSVHIGVAGDQFSSLLALKLMRKQSSGLAKD